MSGGKKGFASRTVHSPSRVEGQEARVELPDSVPRPGSKLEERHPPLPARPEPRIEHGHPLSQGVQPPEANGSPKHLHVSPAVPRSNWGDDSHVRYGTHPDDDEGARGDETRHAQARHGTLPDVPASDAPQAQPWVDESQYWSVAPQSGSDAVAKQLHGRQLRLDESKKHAESLQSQLETVTLSNEKLTDRLKILQAKAFKSVDDARWAAITYADVSTELTAIVAEIKQWSEKNRQSPLLPLRPKGQQALRVMKILLDSDCISTDDWSLETITDLLSESQSAGKTTVLIVQSLLARSLLQYCLETPWASFKGSLYEKNDGEVLTVQDCEALQGLYKKIALGESPRWIIYFHR